LTKITIIGGGSSTFTPQLMRLFVESNVLRGSTITLMDIDAHRLEVMETLSRKIVKTRNAALQVEGTTNQRESLIDADFVVTAISVGGTYAWEKDIEIPARYGVYMPIADSIGPGGIMRAFRHVPVLVGVGKDLEEVSPDAWVFNYTNPVTANTMAMNRHTKVRTVGLCTCSSIPRNNKQLSEMLGVSGDPSLPAPAAGLNHCAAILELRFRDGRDALALTKGKIMNPILKWGLENYGILPYCWSHWLEFFPSLCQLDEEYRGRLQGLRMKYGIRAHDMEHEAARAKKWELLVEEMAREEGKELSLEVLPKGEGIQVVEIIEGILENRNEVHVVNVRNRGAVRNLPRDAIVEVSCVVGRYGIQPIQVGPLPESLAATLNSHIAAQELTVEAALSGDRHTAYRAFLQDPQISSKLTPEQTEKLLDEMLNAHSGLLGGFGATGGVREVSSC